MKIRNISNFLHFLLSPWHILHLSELALKARLHYGKNPAKQVDFKEEMLQLKTHDFARFLP